MAEEPTGDLDGSTESDIMQLFENLNQQGVAIDMVTHSHILATKAGRILTMNAGRVEEGAAV